MKNWLPLFGVIIAQVVILALFWLKQRADDKRRWHDKRLETYARLNRAARDAFNLVNGIDDHDNVDWQKFREAIGVLDECQLDIALLSSEPVREKAEAVNTIVEMLWVLEQGTMGYPDSADLLAARLDFESAVRAELGITRPSMRLAVQADSRAGLIVRAFAKGLFPTAFMAPDLASAIIGRRNSTNDPS